MKKTSVIKNASVGLLVLATGSGILAARDARGQTDGLKDSLQTLESTVKSAKGQTEPIDGFKDTPMLPGGKWHLHDSDRPQPRVVTPGETFSQNAGAPSDAEILFDGKDLSKWEN